ncbi:hypothetical protein [Nesterenkonia natronophila]|uniref:Uncharacterized protein n=1 Tax=Nesterenkonia natronophila TaxID=2174932 RepID=A0A3A4G3B0_9MICC|nr:hypothetical protein [Nesterenkonia natronophila]RJN32749.1 hypothetical protein D3250_02700 [Nesterenkonia natronophila]
MVVRRFAAVLGGLSGLLHLLMLVHGPLGVGLIMAAAALACLPCAGHLWRHGTSTTWVTVGFMNVLMVVLHLGILYGGSHASGAPETGGLDLGHPGHTHDVVSLALPVHGLFLLATVIAGIEVLLCTVGFRQLKRRQAVAALSAAGEEELQLCPNEWIENNAAPKLSAPT